MMRLGMGKTMKRLDDMLTDAMSGSFSEDTYDETELSRLESKWKQYLSSSKMSMERTQKERESIKAMISDISHQTKTPLANIILYSELLGEQPLDEEGHHILNHLHQQAQKLDFLIQSLVKMSRLETDMLEVQPTVQELAPLINQAVEDVSAKARQKGIKIEVDMQEGATALYDMKWTLEALYNILDNAVKYSYEGGAIRVSVIIYKMYCCINVADEGIGIDESEKAQIFQRFYRGREVRQEEGVGIGLYLAREIVRREEGYIKVKSAKGEGSSFGVYLKVFQDT